MPGGRVKRANSYLSDKLRELAGQEWTELTDEFIDTLYGIWRTEYDWQPSWAGGESVYLSREEALGRVRLTGNLPPKERRHGQGYVKTGTTGRT